MNRSVIVPSRPLKVNRASRAGHSAASWARARWESRQAAHAADVDVAHRVLVGARKDGEEVEVLRSSLHGVVRVLQAAQLRLRLQEAVLPGWPASGSWSPRRCPMSFAKARATVTLCSATPFGTLDCCVCTVG